MPRTHRSSEEASTGRAVAAFLKRVRTPNGGDADQLLRRIERAGLAAFIFGGTVRDLLASGGSATPRDIDIVVRYAEMADLERALKPYVVRRTRFGGLHLRAGGWMFDVWPVQDTWAFQSGHVKQSCFTHLPKTTFLDVEAVAVELNPANGTRRRVYAQGFFQAMRQKTIDINLEENPYPSLCVVRSLLTAARLRFAMSRRLGQYAVTVGREVGISKLMEAQQSHYGHIRCSSRDLDHWLRATERQLHDEHVHAIRLPIPSHRQLHFWNDLPMRD